MTDKYAQLRIRALAGGITLALRQAKPHPPLVPPEMSDVPVNELASTLVSRVVIDLDTIRHSLGRSGSQTELVSSARCHIAGLRLLVVRASESTLRSRLLDLLDRMDDELDAQLHHSS